MQTNVTVQKATNGFVVSYKSKNETVPYVYKDIDQAIARLKTIFNIRLAKKTYCEELP